MVGNLPAVQADPPRALLIWASNTAVRHRGDLRERRRACVCRS